MLEVAQRASRAGDGVLCSFSAKQREQRELRTAGHLFATKTAVATRAK